MKRFGPVVATAASPSVRTAMGAARAARAAGADRVEVRLDRFGPGEDVAALIHLAEEIPLVVSGQRDWVGTGEVPLLRHAQSHGAWVDVPFSGDLPEDLFGLDRSRLILSWHDFEGTHPDLGEVLSRLRSVPAAAYKLVPTARDLPDALVLLRLLEKESRAGDLCAFAMGLPGIPTRVLALAWGSCATYAAAPGCEAAAPGQMGLDALLGTYRPRDLRPGDPLYALAGWPLASTKTPSFFNPWLEATGLPGRYLPFPCKDPRDLLASRLPLGGVALTIPHKEAGLGLAQSASRLARRAGACNTLVPAHGGHTGWLAANTDVRGVRCALRRVPGGNRCLLLGTGGAAAAAAMAMGGHFSVCVAGRQEEKTAAFARRWRAEAVPWEARHSVEWDLLVNATPVGAEGPVDGNGENTPYPFDALSGGWIFDMVVREGGTPLLRTAAALGLEAIPGEAMLVPQAALQFRLWTGRRNPKKPAGCP